MPRGGVRPQFTARRSDAWSTPKKDRASANDSAPPSIAGMPVVTDPQMPIERMEFQDASGEAVGAIVGLDDVDPALGLLAQETMEAFAGAEPAPPPSITSEPPQPVRMVGKHFTPPMFTPPPALQLAQIGPLEVDQLWDWVRADREGVMNFLGFIPDHSLHLYKWIDNFQILEREGRARFHSIYVAGSLIGFLMVHPIQQAGAQATGDCHLYVSKDARGNVRSLLPPLLAELDRAVPYLALRVVTARDDEWARLLRGVGFMSQLVLTRPAAALTGNASGS